MNGRRILIVEDEALVARDLGDRLEALGYQPAGLAASGEQALALARQSRPDLVLMDIHLQGGMDGIAVALDLRRQFRIPAVFLTAYSEDSTLERAKQAEPYGYLLKPFEDRELRAALEIALHRHTLDEEIRRLTRIYDVLSQVNQAIVRTRSREALFPAVCQLMVERGEIDVAWIAWRDPATGCLEPAGQFGADGDLQCAARLCPGEEPGNPGPLLAALLAGRPHFCDEPSQEPCICAAAASGGPEYGSWGAFPLRFQGEVQGALCLCVRAPGFFQAREINLLEEVARDISYALDQYETERQRAAAEESLRQSEQRFRSWFELPLIGICIASPEKGWLEVNDRLCEILGYGRAELRRLTWAELTHPDDLEAELAQFNQVLAGRQEGYSLEKRFLRQDGTVIHAGLAVRGVRGAGGAPDYFVALVQDITARKQAEQKLRTVMENAPDTILQTDRQGSILFLNRPAAGAEREKILGTRIHGWVLPEQHGLLDRVLQAVFETGQPQEYECQGLRPDGEVRSYGVRVRPVMINGQAESAIFTATDITGRRELEERLRQAQKMEAVGQLAGGVAHDFNNILSAMMMNLSLLIHHPGLDEEARQAVQEVESEARRSAALTRQLLIFSRRSVLEIKVVDLNEVIEHVLKMLRRLIGEHIDLAFEACNQLPPVAVDPGMMEQILMNLAVNARDAMPLGGRLVIRTQLVCLGEEQAGSHPGRRPGQFACFSAADTGCGMDAATLKRIFEPFFTTKEAGKGTGLGLATIYGIVAQHHGWVEVDSQPGQGTTFRVFIPAEAGLEVEHGEVSEPGAIRGGPETILLVEDYSTFRRNAAQRLRLLGYRVLEAANGPEALATWAQEASAIDLLLTDVVMPGGLSGVGLAERLRGEKPGLKVILTSGYNWEATGLVKPQGHGVHFLAKPYDERVLCTAVRDCLDRQ